MRRTHRSMTQLVRGALVAAVAITGFAVAGPLTAPVDAQADQIPDDGLPAAPIAASPIVSRRTEILQAGVVGINKANDTFAVHRHQRCRHRRDRRHDVHRWQVHPGRDRRRPPALRPAVPRRIRPHDRRVDRHVPPDDRRQRLGPEGHRRRATHRRRAVHQRQRRAEHHRRGDDRPHHRCGRPHLARRPRSSPAAPTGRSHARSTSKADSSTSAATSPASPGPNGVETRAGQIARVSLATGNVDRSFLPNFDGVVFDIDATPDRVYVAGNFKYVNDIWSIGIGVLDPQGALVPGLEPWVRTSIEQHEPQLSAGDPRLPGPGVAGRLRTQPPGLPGERLRADPLAGSAIPTVTARRSPN